MKKLKKIRNLLIGVLVVAAVCGIVYWNNNRHSIYDYSHLINRADYGESREFTPLANVKEIDGLVPVVQNDTLILYVDPETSCIAVYDKRNGEIWYTTPPDIMQDSSANVFEKGMARSMLGFRYYNDRKRRNTRWLYPDAAEDSQFQLYSIPNGLRVVYQVGDMSLGVNALPKYLTPERLEERVLANIEDDADRRWLGRMFMDSVTKPGFKELLNNVNTNVINGNRVIRLFDSIGYTLEELEEDNAAANYEVELNLDFFTIEMEFVINGDTLSVNLPLDKVQSEADNRLFYLDFMKFFGAGGLEDEGYMMVPSGSGALIEFNNGKVNEETFINSVYALDPLMTTVSPQILQTTRLPVLGIKKNDAAMLAYVESGAGMASVVADVSGKTNSYNTAYFSFLLRDYSMLPLATGSESDMTVVQPYTYEGDITVSYCFLANENGATYSDMAEAYQRYLVDKGVLTPKVSAGGDTSFYMDIIGAIEKQKFILGTPYTSMESMTTYEEMGEILDVLDQNGIDTVQLRLQGWFNKGMNHDVAKKVNPINTLGSKKEMQALNERLQANGGGLYPAVNFIQTNFYTKNINTSYEITRNPTGYIGVVATFNRELLRTQNTMAVYRSDWHYLISPGVLPLHLDKFLPAFEKLGLGSLCLMDMGDILTESIYRKDQVDRESSRLISQEQVARVGNEVDRLMVSGGNDYALAGADILVDVPTEADFYYLIDHEIPFYQMVVHGFLEYSGVAVNTRENQDTQRMFLNMLATGASPHYMWTMEPTLKMEFTPYEKYYSTQYELWLEEAVNQYHIFNDIYKDLKTAHMTDFIILANNARNMEKDVMVTGKVTATVYSDGTRVYVNTTEYPFNNGTVSVPAMGYAVERGDGR